MASPIDLLRDSFNDAAAREPALIERFYDELFRRAPELAPMFRRGRREQAEMLHVALASVLDHLEDPPWLAATLGALGARHVSYGVTPAMYRVVGEALIATLAATCAGWSREHERAWLEAYTAIVNLMLAGARAAAA